MTSARPTALARSGLTVKRSDTTCGARESPFTSAAGYVSSLAYLGERQFPVKTVNEIGGISRANWGFRS